MSRNKLTTPVSDFLTGRSNVSPVAYTSLYMNNSVQSRFLSYQHPEFYSPTLTRSTGRGSRHSAYSKVRIEETPGQRMQRFQRESVITPRREPLTVVPEQFDEHEPDNEARPVDAVQEQDNQQLVEEQPAVAESVPVAEEASAGSASTIDSALSSLADIDPVNIPIEAAFGGLSLAANAAASAQIPANTIAGKYDQMQTRNNASTMGSDALLGATLGSALGPIGSLVGGVLGGALGYNGPAKVPTTSGDQDVTKFTNI